VLPDIDVHARGSTAKKDNNHTDPIVNCQKKYKYSGMTYQTVIAAMGICNTDVGCMKRLLRHKKNSTDARKTLNLVMDNDS
jgi:hypothetical protein